MPPRILIAGPHGAGKSTIVRRIMSLYRDRRLLPGGVGSLPRGYSCGRFMGGDHEDLCVLGNYERSFRDRHGMSEFDRYKTDFVAVLGYANSLKCAVLCEGGFVHPRRLACDAGREFSKSCIIVWLSPASARADVVTRNGRCVDDVGFERHIAASMSVVEKMCEFGANVMAIEDRDDAMKKICLIIDPRLHPEQAAPFMYDYR